MSQSVSLETRTRINTYTTTIFNDAGTGTLVNFQPISTGSLGTAYLEKFSDATVTALQFSDHYDVLLPGSATKSCVVSGGKALCVQAEASTTLGVVETPVFVGVVQESVTETVPITFSPSGTPVAASDLIPSGTGGGSAIAQNTATPSNSVTPNSSLNRLPPRFTKSSIIAVTVILVLLLLTFLILTLSLRRKRKVEDTERAQGGGKFGFDKESSSAELGSLPSESTEKVFKLPAKSKKFKTVDFDSLKITPFRMSMWPKSAAPVNSPKPGDTSAP